MQLADIFGYGTAKASTNRFSQLSNHILPAASNFCGLAVLTLTALMIT